MSLWNAIARRFGFKTIRGMSFDELLLILKPRLDWQVRAHRGKLPGYDDDDVRQELMIELWEKLPKIPKDIVSPDYRFTRYIETMFNRRIISIHRSLLVARRKGEYRDILVKAQFIEDFERVENDQYHSTS